jgi:hypothetical protein
MRFGGAGLELTASSKPTILHAFEGFREIIESGKRETERIGLASGLGLLAAAEY